MSSSAGTPTAPVAAVTWPRSGADIDGGTAASPHAFLYPDPAAWQWLRPSTGPQDPACATAGVSLEPTDIGAKNTPSSEIRYGASARDVYIYVETRNMPATARSARSLAPRQEASSRWAREPTISTPVPGKAASWPASERSSMSLRKWLWKSPPNHNVSAPAPRLQFATVHAGLRIRF